MPNLGMNVVVWHSLALASLLHCQPFLGWQIFHWLTGCDPEKSYWPEKITHCWPNLQIKGFKLIKY